MCFYLLVLQCFILMLGMRTESRRVSCATAEGYEVHVIIWRNIFPIVKTFVSQKNVTFFIHSAISYPNSRTVHRLRAHFLTYTCSDVYH